MTGSEDDVFLRPARPDDADAIARIHAEAWQVAYRDLMPPDLLDRFGLAPRQALWRGLLQQSRQPPYVIVAARAGPEPDLAAFVWYRTTGAAGAAFESEIVSVNVHPDRQRRGLGRRLMAAAADALAARGAASLYLWVYRQNAAARAFYESLGGRIVDADMETYEDHVLPIVAYAWKPLDRLRDACRRRGP